VFKASEIDASGNSNWVFSETNKYVSKPAYSLEVDYSTFKKKKKNAVFDHILKVLSTIIWESFNSLLYRHKTIVMINEIYVQHVFTSQINFILYLYFMSISIFILNGKITNIQEHRVPSILMMENQVQ